MNYFLTDEEANRLKEFIEFFYTFSLETEKYSAPVPYDALKSFREDPEFSIIVNHNLNLTEAEKGEWEDVFKLWYAGDVSGFKRMSEINTAEELLRELRK